MPTEQLTIEISGACLALYAPSWAWRIQMRLAAARKLVGPREFATLRNSAANRRPALRIVSCHNEIDDLDCAAPTRSLAAKVVMEKLVIGGPAANRVGDYIPASSDFVYLPEEVKATELQHSASAYRARMVGRHNAKRNRQRTKAFLRRVAEEWG